MHRLISIALGIALISCGTVTHRTIYVPFVAGLPTVMYPGDSCAPPHYYLDGPISSSSKAMVGLTAERTADAAVLRISVTITGESKFKFDGDSVALQVLGIGNVGAGTRVPMSPFTRSSGLASMAKRNFSTAESFEGPQKGEYKSIYAENRYEVLQWMFTSNVRLPASPVDKFSVQLPDAEVDGQRIRFPPVRFETRDVVFRDTCFK